MKAVILVALLSFAIFGMTQVSATVLNDGLCAPSAPPNPCTPGQTYCASGGTAACQYTCQGPDGGTGSWTSGVDCGTGSICNVVGIGGKCTNWGPPRSLPEPERQTFGFDIKAFLESLKR